MCADHNRYPFPPIHTPDHPTEFKWGGKRVGFEEVVQVLYATTGDWDFISAYRKAK